MPTLQLKISPAQPPDNHARLAVELTTITAGTNSPAQKAAFIEAAFAVLQRQLRAGQPLEPAQAK